LRCGVANPPQPLSGLITSAAAGVLQSLPAGLQVVLRNPSLFQLSADELDDRRVLMVALQERLSLAEAELVSIIVACPSLLSMRFAEEVEPRLTQLQGRLQLSDNALRTVVLGAPLVLGAGASRVEAQLVLLESFGLSVAQLRRAVVARPSLLDLSVAETRAAIAGLQDHLGLREKELAGLLAGQPRVLWGCEERLSEMAERYGLSRTQLRQVVLGWPSALETAELGPGLGRLRSKLQLSEAESRRVLLKNPMLLGQSYEAQLLPMCEATQARLGLSDEQLRKVVVAIPSLLTFSYEGNVAPSLDALQHRLGLSEEELRKVVLGLPQVVALSYADNVAPSLDSLQARLGLSDDELRHLATRLPQLLGLSISANIEPKLSFLQQQLEFDEETLRHEVLRAPTVLGSSLADSLRPNAEMWQAVLRAEGLDLGAEIARRGLLFLCFSHQRRTKPRLERLLRAGLPASLALPKMQLTEAKWEQWCRYKGA